GHGPGDLIDLSFEGDTVSVGHDAGLARPLRLTTDEALALVVALRTLADEPRLTDRGAVERALAKVEAAAGGAVEAASAVAVADETTERDVDPVRLRWADGRWYLEAWCRSVGAMRFFRIDRVDAVEILDEPSAPPADAVPRDLSEGIYQPAPEHPLVTLRLDQPGRWVAEYYACETASPLPDGRLEVTLRAADPAW